MGGAGGGGGGDDTGGEEVDLALDYELKDVQDYIFSRIVDKVSDKFFLQAWAHEVAEIAQAHIARINAMLDYDESGEMYAECDKTSAESAAYQKRAEELRAKFDEFMADLRQNINDAIARQQAVEMLSQHIITAPIFGALFGWGSGLAPSKSETLHAIILYRARWMLTVLYLLPIIRQ